MWLRTLEGFFLFKVPVFLCPESQDIFLYYLPTKFRSSRLLKVSQVRRRNELSKLLSDQVSLLSINPNWIDLINYSMRYS